MSERKSGLMIQYILEVYPNSLLNPTKEKIKNKNNYYIIIENSASLYIPLKELSKKEIQLLTIILEKEKIIEKEPSNLKKLLYKGITEDFSNYHSVQLIYLKVEHLEKNSYKLWKKTLMDSINRIIDLNFINDDLIIVLIEAKKERELTIKKLKEVIKSLDQDFNLLSQGMIGQMINLDKQIVNIFAYEKSLFKKIIQKERGQGILSLTDLLISQLGELLKKENLKLPKLLHLLSSKVEVRELITFLFKNQGNLSQTAADLFIHRNTLSYRMNKFFDKTGFNLNYFPDLIVCYLLLA